MALSAKFVRAQLERLKPLTQRMDLESVRKGQSRIGELMQFLHRKEVAVRRHGFDHFEGGWVLPDRTM